MQFTHFMIQHSINIVNNKYEVLGDFDLGNFSDIRSFDNHYRIRKSIRKRNYKEIKKKLKLKYRSLQIKLPSITNTLKVAMWSVRFILT